MLNNSKKNRSSDMQAADSQRISSMVGLDVKPEIHEPKPDMVNSLIVNIAENKENSSVTRCEERKQESHNSKYVLSISKAEELDETHQITKKTTSNGVEGECEVYTPEAIAPNTFRKRGRQSKSKDNSNMKRRRKNSGNTSIEERQEKEREKRQQRYMNRREEKIEKQREYYSKNRERMVEKQADYYKANRQEVIARQYEYYQKNRNKITEKKRQWYQEKRGFVSTKKVVHPSLVEAISPQEPTKEGSGVVRIKHLKPIIDKFNNEMNRKWKIVYDIQHGSDFISNCGIDDHSATKLGESKLNSLSDKDAILTMPKGYSYRCKPLAPSDLAHVESFVALAVSKDEECLDLRYLLHQDNITLEGMRDLFHAIQSVLDIDMHDFMTEKQSLFFINPTCLSNPVLKNRFCKQVSRIKGLFNLAFCFWFE